MKPSQPPCAAFLKRTMNLNAKRNPAGTTYWIDCALPDQHDGPHVTAAGKPMTHPIARGINR